MAGEGGAEHLPRPPSGGRAPPASPDRLVAEAEIHRQVVEAVLDLREPYRSVILLRFFQELAPAEVATHLGIALLRDTFDRAEGGNRRVWSLALLPLVRGAEAVHGTVAVHETAAAAAATQQAAFATGALVMSKQVVAIATVTLVLGAGVGWYVASEGASPGEPAAGVDGSPQSPHADDAVSPPRLQGSSPTAATNAAAIARLQETVTRLEKALVEVRGGKHLDPEKRKVEVLERLKAIEHGERQVAIKEAVKDLVTIGDPVVTDLVQLLRDGFERDWGGGFSTGGNAVKSYGRMRMVLIDALRQIGTEEAKRGLLESMDETEDWDDYRDLFLLFGSTKDPQMIEGISALIPGLLERFREEGLARVGETSTLLPDMVVRWIRRHEMTGLMDEVAELVETSPADDRGAGYFFGLLIQFAPERAAVVSRTRYEKDPKGTGGHRLLRYQGHGEVPLAQVTRYLELVLADLDLTERERGSLYTSIRAFPCRYIEDLEARAKDARVLLAFLERQRKAETSESIHRYLDMSIRSLRRQIEKLEPK